MLIQSKQINSSSLFIFNFFVCFFLRTDSLIQKTIRTKFSECTVITIAHRLNTIMDCDRVLVVENGYAVELDHPHRLLKNGGSFKSMVDQTGSGMAAFLAAQAETNFNAKKTL